MLLFRVQEARSTLAYMRKTQNYMTSRGAVHTAEPVPAALALSPHSQDEANPLSAAVRYPSRSLCRMLVFVLPLACRCPSL